jgi:hypothetical protein
MTNNEQIIVYDNYEISLYKYPRKDTDKEKTDIMIIIFLMNEEILKSIAKSFDNSLKFYHECKEYYFIFKFNKDISYTKKYTAQDIILLFNNTNEFIRNNNNIYNQKKYLNNMVESDKILYFYLKNKEFYLHLFESLEHAKKAYFERRDYTYRIIPPIDFYDNLFPQIYSAIELMEINAYTQYLVKRKIIQDLPKPKY